MNRVTTRTDQKVKTYRWIYDPNWSQMREEGTSKGAFRMAPFSPTMKTFRAAAVMFLAGAVLCGQVRSFPNCLGPFCLGHSTLARTLLEQLGEAPRRADGYCYSSENGKEFLFIETNEVLPGIAVAVILSDFKNCLHQRVNRTQNDLRAWRTREGIGLGSSEEEVLRAYGKPKEIHKARSKDYGRMVRGYREGDKIALGREIPDKYLWYPKGGQDELTVVVFGIRQGKVSYIWLNENE